MMVGQSTSKICLMDLLLSITVSLPTSKQPICLGSIVYFSRSEVTAVKLQIKIPSSQDKCSFEPKNILSDANRI